MSGGYDDLREKKVMRFYGDIKEDMYEMLSFRNIACHRHDMKRLVLGIILLVGLTSAEEPSPKQQLNGTKEESNINKRYILTLPQYNSLFYANSQEVPTQILNFGNDQTFPNYINSLPVNSSPYSNAPQYYLLPGDNYLQTYTGQRVVPQIQNNLPPGLSQGQVVPQQAISPEVLPRQQVIPQQLVPQQAIPQRVVPQQIVSQGAIQQQVLPQQIVSQQTVPQQVLPQSLIQQRIIPQPAILERVVPQQFVLQRVIPPQLLTQRIIPQQVIPQRVVQPQIVPRIQNNVAPPQQIIQNNAFATIGQPPFQTKDDLQYQLYQPQSPVPPFQTKDGLQYQLYQPQSPVVPFQVKNNLQYQLYQPQPQKAQALVGNEPYPYEVPPGQKKLPVATAKQVPLYLRVPQSVPYVYPYGKNLFYNLPPSTTYNSNPYVQSQSQTVYVNPNLQAVNDGAQQVVRIGYRHPQLNREVVPNAPHHTVYLNPNLYTTYDGSQPIVRIGYVHPNLNEIVQGQNGNEPQRLKLGIPFPLQQNGGNSYQYSNNDRSTRTPDIGDKGQFKPKETEVTKT